MISEATRPDRGLRVVLAEPDGTRVERAAATFKPDIALIDMRLGDGVDGITVARRLKGTDDFPLLFLTSATAIEDVLAAYDVGGDDYVVKPFVMAELVARMRAVLRRSEREERTVSSPASGASSSTTSTWSRST